MDILKDKFLKINVLDHGYVELIDCMPRIVPEGRTADSSIVLAARTSTTHDLKSPEADKRLLKRLYKDKHTSPFEQVNFTFVMKLPLFVLNQIIRHRTARVNVFSGRYSIMKDEFYIPIARVQDTVNKQMSLNTATDEQILLVSESFKLCEDIYKTYEKMIESGIAREVARMILPQNIYTSLTWNMDLHNLLHFLKLRLADDCQYETREYAKAIYSLVKPLVPVSCEAFEEFELNK